MIADINFFVNRLRRDCKTGLLNRTNNHKFWQPNVQQDSITAQFNYHSIQLQQNSSTAHSIPQHYNQPNRP
ncbi:hypothetical protein LXL04_000719 [Taraxacum kok-saghyz]